MRYFIFLLVLSFSQAELAYTSNKVIFQLSCERTYLRILSEYMVPKDLRTAARGLADSCEKMADNAEKPIALGCILAMRQMRSMQPTLPSEDELFKKFCLPVVENK